jgi:hypothetical protein
MALSDTDAIAVTMTVQQWQQVEDVVANAALNATGTIEQEQLDTATTIISETLERNGWV